MTILPIVIYGLIAFSILVIVHEFGHFLMAKLTGVKVLVFSVGFGKKLLRFHKGETEYAVSAVPLGGYVKMLGESSDDEVSQEEEHRSFAHKPPCVRLLIAVMGPLFNIIFAFILFYFMILGGYYSSSPSNRVGEVQKDMPAYAAGMRDGDTILEIGGMKVREWNDIPVSIELSPKDQPVKVKIERDGKVIELFVTSRETEDKEAGIRRRIIGVRPYDRPVQVDTNVITALPLAAKKTYAVMRISILGIVKLVQGVISPKNLGGPILIFKEAGKRAERGLIYFVDFVALISISLGIFNLFPIPVLDGGHILFNLIEVIIRRKISERWINMAQKVGLAIIILIMIFAFYNDIDRMTGFSKYFHGK